MIDVAKDLYLTEVHYVCLMATRLSDEQYISANHRSRAIDMQTIRHFLGGNVVT